MRTAILAVLALLATLVVASLSVSDRHAFKPAPEKPANVVVMVEGDEYTIPRETLREIVSASRAIIIHRDSLGSLHVRTEK